MAKKTPLYKIDSLETDFGLINTFVKDESYNPSGTIKDRRNIGVISEAIRLGVEKLVVITSGNNGYSLAKLAQGHDVKVVCVVNRNMPQKYIQKLEEVAYQVIKVNLDEKILRPEEVIAFARERDDEVIWDVTNGFEDWYMIVIKEILKDIKKPDYIVVPMGSGGIFVGVVEALKKLSPETKVIAIGPQSSRSSYADKLFTPWTPYAKLIEKYIAFGHAVFRISEEQIKKTYQTYRHLCNCEPSAAIVFAAPSLLPFKPSDNIVFINTGNSKIYSD